MFCSLFNSYFSRLSFRVDNKEIMYVLGFVTYSSKTFQLSTTGGIASTMKLQFYKSLSLSKYT